MTGNHLELAKLTAIGNGSSVPGIMVSPTEVVATNGKAITRHEVRTIQSFRPFVIDTKKALAIAKHARNHGHDSINVSDSGVRYETKEGLEYSLPSDTVKANYQWPDCDRIWPKGPATISFTLDANLLVPILEHIRKTYQSGAVKTSAITIRFYDGNPVMEIVNRPCATVPLIQSVIAPEERK